MSLPQFDVQGLFESLGAIASDLFKENDKYKLFARKVWPVLARCRKNWPSGSALYRERRTVCGFRPREG